jgi:hypothetical protein
MYVVDLLLQRLVYWIYVICGAFGNVCEDDWKRGMLELPCHVFQVMSHNVDVPWLILDTITKPFSHMTKPTK